MKKVRKNGSDSQRWCRHSRPPKEQFTGMEWCVMSRNLRYDEFEAPGRQLSRDNYETPGAE